MKMTVLSCVVSNNSQTMCFHLGMTEGFVSGYGTSAEQELSQHETQQMLQEIYHQIMRENGKYVYSHKVRCLP